MSAFSERVIDRWEDFLACRRDFGDEWVFRGQPSDWKLTTSLERACANSEIALASAPGIEIQIIRDFRRRYDGIDRELVRTDTLYCLALIQHHVGPTRLLDWTYSPYVALYFALESG